MNCEGLHNHQLLFGYQRKIVCDPFLVVIFITGHLEKAIPCDWMVRRLQLRCSHGEGIMKTPELIGNLTLCLAVVYGAVDLVVASAAAAIGWLHL